MPPEAPFAVGEAPLRILPIVHYRMEFARAVREAIEGLRPGAVAVELPPSLGEAFQQAVQRLPYVSVIVCQNEDGSALYLPVEPADPLVEAVRTARELGIPLHFVDLNVTGYPEHRDLLPDSYALHATGLRGYWEAYAAGGPPATSQVDRQRESHMAAVVKKLSAETDVLLVCGIAHVQGILAAASSGKARVHRHRRVEAVRLADPDLDSVREICAEMPLVNAFYEFTRGGSGPAEAWAPPPEPPSEEEAPAPKPTRLDGLTGLDALRSLESLLGMGGGAKIREEDLPPEVRRAVARYLQGMRDPGLRLPGEGDAPPPALVGAPQAPRPRIFKFRSVPDRRPELRRFFRDTVVEAGAPGPLDRQRLIARLLDRAAAHYADNTGETFKTWQRRVLTQFAGNYTRLQGMLLPGLYQLVVSARGVADDNYAYEVWDLGSFYPWTEKGDGLPTIKIRAGEVWVDGVKSMRFRRRFPRLREKLVRMPVKSRPPEENAGDWVREFQRGTICSYPPEDVVIEDFGRYLQKKALQVLSEERTRVEEFTTSMLDGLEMRETLRNWHQGRKIYVQENQRVKGGAGSVVLIFDEDEENRYPWIMSWHGEHDQESDMAFYATPASAKIVGPGIARCEYGGLMLTYPPGRLMDVWSDPVYGEARSKSELLLMAAIDYSEEKHVVYVAPKPPRTWFRTFAARLGKKVVYLPLGQLSPVSLKKIRVFHVLSGHRVRRIAKDYIW